MGTHMRYFALAMTSLLVAGVMPGVALADATLRLSIVANVDVFCRVTQSDENVIEVHDGAASLGAVKEICNTPSGYVVTTQLSNITAGVLDVAGQSIPIDSSGMAVRTSTEPDMRTMTWRLADATLDRPDGPVFMRVTIAPR
jgi:hypothetical protein